MRLIGMDFRRCPVRVAVIILAFLPPFTLPAADKEDDRTLPILGWVEWVVVPPEAVRLKAKLDTGALTSSLHAEAIEAFERDGEDWVRFSVPLDAHRDDVDEDSEVRGFAMERPVTRTVLIKRHGAESQRRYVITLPFCIGGDEYETQFSLTDRGDFTYAVLLGRRFLETGALVHSGETFLAREDCDYSDVGALVDDEREELDPLEGEPGNGRDDDEDDDEAQDAPADDEA